MESLKLGNTFVPKSSPTVTARLLSRLRVDELVNIALLWLTIPQTMPRPPTVLLEAMGVSKQEFLVDYKQWLQKLKAQKSQANKRRVMDKLLVDIYPRGLNLLQHATLDSQLLVSKENAYAWSISRITSHDLSLNVTITIEDPQQFLQSLVGNLSTIYLTHIYISRHPHYPLIIIRVQLFDLMGTQDPADSVVTRKPVHIGLPVNSDKVLITQSSGTDDTAADFVIHAVERAICESLNKEVQLIKEPHLDPIHNVESAFVLAGNSRFSQSLGPWAPYASGDVDISPFDDVKDHDTFKSSEALLPSDAKKRIAMMRFKGGVSKVVKPYEGGRKRRRKAFQDLEIEEENEEELEEDIYASIVPIQQIEFDLRNKYIDFTPKLMLRFQGTDVFGGLHELCDRGMGDAETIPGWLTGETLSSGQVNDGVFITRKKAANEHLMTASLI